MTAPATEAPAPASPPQPAPVKPPKPRASGSPVLPLLMIGFGGYLLWFGVRYWRGAGPATWPSYPIKSILQGKGLPPNQSAPSAEATLATLEQSSPSSSGTIAGYANPFGGAKNLTPERIDQGVDYSGSGEIRAIGPAVITHAATGDTGWGPSQGGLAPGGYIRYKLEGGPAAGKEVYVAEGVEPSVTVGQKVSAGEVIGRFASGVGPGSGGTAGIETGWAGGPGTGTLSQQPQAGGIGGAGPFPTAVGVNFDRLMVALGVKPAPNIGQTSYGDVPSGYPQTWGTEPAQGRPQNTAKMLLGQYGWGSGQFPPLVSLWTRESGWSPTAKNPKSGALGIAQALGHGGGNTIGTLGDEYGAEYGLSVQQAQAANSGNVLQQIRWGLGYIRDRYGTPSSAWAHEQAVGWYMHGGTIKPGQTGIVGEAGQPEYVTATPEGAVVTPGAPQPAGR